MFELEDGWWVHKYDSNTEEWLSYWVNMTGTNFNIYPWDTLAIVGNKNKEVRINITNEVITSQSKTIPQGYSYLVWTDAENTTSKNLTSAGLENGDWIFIYNTEAGTWEETWLGYGGVDIKIVPYKTMIVLTADSRTINIG